MSTAAELVARRAVVDAEDDNRYRTRYAWQIRSTLERLFEPEKAVARKPTIAGRCAKTGAVEIRVSHPPAAPSVALPVPDLFHLGDCGTRPLEPFDFAHYRAIRRQKALSERLDAVSTADVHADFNRPPIDTEDAFLRAEAAAMREPIGPGWDDSLLAEQADAAAGEFLEWAQGEADFRELCRSETGRVLSAEVAAEKWARLETQVRQTERLCDALETAGMPMRFADTPEESARTGRAYRPAVWIVPAAEPTRAVKFPNVRRVNFFPTQAATRRAPMLRALRYVLQGQPWARMMTLTSGTRWRPDASLDHLGDGYRSARKAWSEIVKHRWFRRHARPLFLGVEFGEPVQDPTVALGPWHLHIHGHLLFVPAGRFSRDQWERFERWVRLRLTAQFCGETGRKRRRICWRCSETHAKDNGIIRDAAEVCKYPVKPADLETLLSDAGPGAIRAFYEATVGARVATPLGEVRELRNRMARACPPQRFVTRSTPEGSVVSIVANWNRQSRDPFAQAEKTRRRSAFRRAKSEKAVAARSRRDARHAKRLFLRLANRLARVENRIARARERLGAGARGAYWRAVLAASEAERSAVVRELARMFETATAALALAGIDQPPAAVVAYWAKTGAFVEYNGPDADATARPTAGKPQAVVRNRLLGRIAPAAFGDCRVTQPGFAVIGWDGDFEHLAAAWPKQVGETAQDAQRHVAAALACAARVDALPPLRAHGAPAHAVNEGSHYPHNSPRGGEEWLPGWPPEAQNAPETTPNPAGFAGVLA